MLAALINIANRNRQAGGVAIYYRTKTGTLKTADPDQDQKDQELKQQGRKSVPFTVSQKE